MGLYVSMSLKQLKQKKKPLMGCSPLYPPLELFHAMGLTPVVLWGWGQIASTPASDNHVQNYACAPARQLVQFVLEEGKELLDGIFTYNACDTIRNLPEILGANSDLPLFQMHLPFIPLGRAGSDKFMTGEIRSLVKDLEQVFHTPFSVNTFRDSVRLYGAIREYQRKLDGLTAEGKLSFTDFSCLVRENTFRSPEKQLDTLAQCWETRKDAPGTLQGKKVMVSGILPPWGDVTRMMEEAGLSVVCNDVALMGRSYGHGPEASLSPEAPLSPEAYYLDFYKDHAPCTTLLGLKEHRADGVLKTAVAHGLQGVIFYVEKFCEYENFEVPWLKKQLEKQGMKVLVLEYSAVGSGNAGQLRTRIETFAEII